MTTEVGSSGRLSRRAALRASAAMSAGLVLAAGARQAGTRRAKAAAEGVPLSRLRWDIIHNGPGAAAPADRRTTPGGTASARTVDRTKITVTGSGTFNSDVPDDVSGGGSYTIYDANDSVLSSGSYTVTRLVSWQLAPGTANPGVDTIGSPTDFRPGLAILAVAYTDGQQGMLAVSCHGQGTSNAVFEGIVASHAYTMFFSSEVAQGEPFIDANRTIFHVL